LEDLQTQYDTSSSGCINRTSARRCIYIHSGFDSKLDYTIFFLLALQPPPGVVFYSPLAALAFSLARFHDHIQRRATVGRTPLNECSVRRRDLYLTTQHSQHTNIQALGGIRTHDRSRRAAVDLRLRSCGHWDRRTTRLVLEKEETEFACLNPLMVIKMGR